MKEDTKVISIILLVIILIMQTFIIYKKSYSGYMFNPRTSTEKVNIDYIVLAKNLEFIKEFIPLNDNSIMSIIFAQNEKYDICLFYNFNIRMFYPITMPKDHRCADITNYTTEGLKNTLKKNKNNYLVIIGKNIQVLNAETKKDISIFKVNYNYDVELNLIADYDNDLYSLRENSYVYKKNNYDETMVFIKKYLKDYSYYYGLSVYNYLYDFANKLVENNEISLANEYYDIYLELPLINTDIINNKINIYLNRNDKKGLKNVLDYCDLMEWCNLKDLEVVVEE